MSSHDNEFKLTITQDKLVDILMHAATREDIAKLDTKLDLEIKNLATITREEVSKLDLEIKSLASTTREDISKLDLEIKSLASTTREDISKLDTKIDTQFNKLDSKLDKLIWGVLLAILIPVTTQMLIHFVK